MEALELINRGSKDLKNLEIKSHRLDSEILLSTVLRMKREKILTNLNQKVKPFEINKFKNFITRRSIREPIAYITKEKEFWSKTFEVNKSTLIPRPETEIIVELLSKKFKDKKINILDIGTGSGCILISLLHELKNSKGIGIDISNKTLFMANKNALRHKINSRTKFLCRSMEQLYNQKFDLIVSNPPYIKSIDIKNLDDDIRRFEPKLALDGGKDGLDVIKKVIYKSKRILKLSGLLAIEIGNKQQRKVSEILTRNNYRIKHKIKDYRDNVRFLVSTLKK